MRGPAITPLRIPPLPREQWTDDAREVFAFWGEPDAWNKGSRTNSQMVMANHPALAMAFNRFGKHLLIGNSVPPWARELATLRIAWHLKSHYEWHYHVGYALKLGMTLDQISDVGAGPEAGSWSELDAAVLRCVDELWARSGVTDETWSVLASHYSTPQLMDLIFSIGYYAMLGWALSAFGVELEQGAEAVGFDLRTPSGGSPEIRLKPGESEGWADAQYAD